MTVENQAFREKRNFIRLKVDSPVEVNLTAKNETLSGICLDLSGGGLSIVVGNDLPVNTELVVTLASAHGHGPTLKTKARVTRSTPHERGYALGLEILEMLN